MKKIQLVFPDAVSKEEWEVWWTETGEQHFLAWVDGSDFCKPLSPDWFRDTIKFSYIK
jgi:hypothetical protein